MQRTDIRQNDVFISWTGKDRELKNQIVSFLRENDITCTESDHNCAGDFRQWSREAVGKCTVFLVLYTENTVNSEFVPVEVEEFLKLDDYKNRCVPVVSDFSLYANHLPQLAQNESAVVLDGCELTQNHLEKILYNVQTLINNRLCKVYRESTKPTYMRLVSMLKAMHVADREFDHNRLYINRTVIDVNGKNIIDTKDFVHADDILFLQGPAGCGKSCYIDQLKNAADDKTLVMALPCRKLIDTTDLITSMFTEFRRCCGNRHFYTMDDFKSLLLSRHLLLVLDGMDEIATEKGTRKFLDVVRDYYALNADSTTLFFTSRNEADADLIAINGQTPKKLMLKSLEEDQIKVFGENLFLMFGSPDKSDDFYVRIQDFADEIRTNPLLLSQLAIVYDKKNEIPQTTVEIYDAVCEITLSREDDIIGVPDDYWDMVTRNLSHILKAFSAERYRLLSLGKQIDTAKILAVIMKNEYADAHNRAEFLEEYLHNRAMLIDGEFYHKMLLEYFTAVYHYEKCFDDYDELENTEALKDVFSHYSDPYWSAVLQMFLIKADNLVDSKTAAELYSELMTYGITEYTLLFDTCRNLIVHKEETQCALLRDIIKKSADGIYPPYGPLFWYVPEYGLYEAALLALGSIQDAECFTKALALIRDVCWIFGHYNTTNEITNRVNGKALLEKAVLSGVRQGLCELFFAGNTDFALGNDVYPRCFNIAEAKNRKKNGCGVLGRMPNAFEDELNLYSHEMFGELNGEWIGVVAARYDAGYIESLLPSKSCKKLCGLFLSPTDFTTMKRLAINGRHIRILYIPETTELKELDCFGGMPLELNVAMLNGNLLYCRDNLTLIDCGITEINSSAFEGCNSLTSITLPNGLTKIGDSAFSGCSSLASVNLPDGLTKIGEYAFFHCLSLKSINFPNSLTKISNAAFAFCISLTSVNLPDSLTEIGFSVFMYCQSLTSVKLPNNLTKINADVFGNCSSLASVNLPDSLTEIENSAFEGCRSLVSINLPNGLTKIDWSAFDGCCSLTSIILPNGLTKIGDSAFSGCSSLASINLPDSLTKIEDKTFKDCFSLTSVSLPNGLTEIGDSAFDGCSSLASVNLPSSLKKIGYNSFSNCRNLKVINNCLKEYSSIDLGVTEDCFINYRNEKLQTIIIPENEAHYFRVYFAGRRDIEKVQLPKSITKIAPGAFEECCSLVSINLPDSLTQIDGYTFRGCRSLTSVVLPDGLAEIGFSAFQGCSSLTSVNLPNSLTKIGKWAFEDCRSLTAITLPNKLKEIGDCTFSGCRSLTSVNLPDSLTEIGSSAFKDCSSLASVNLPNGLTKIDWSAFDGCSSLMSVNLPNSLTKIGKWAFKDCRSLTAITLPNKLKEIGNCTFSGCNSLTSVNLPDGLTEIEMSAFEGCSSLTSINFPNSLTKIGISAFEGCNSLTSVNLPDGLTEIGSSAFKGCKSLTSVVIAKSIRFIRENTFEDCTGIQEITVSRRFEDDLSSIFYGVDLSKVKINWL